MSNIAIEFNNVGKQYRLGRVGTGTLAHDINRWWQTSILGREDPYLKIGETNDRSTKAESEYVWALKDISFQVEQGDVVGIIGKNGAGKSTLLKLLSHITSPSTGSIKYKGRIASLLEVGTGFHPELTGRENIYMNGSIMGMTKAEITSKLDEIVDFAGCEKYIDTPVKRYSSGMTVRLGFAVAAFLEPEILVVDEVLAVGDAEFQKKAIGKMQDVSKGNGRTVLFVSHNMNSVRLLCKNAIVLNNGLIEMTGTADECVEHYIGTNIQEITPEAKINEKQHEKNTYRDIEIKEVKILNKDPKAMATDEPILIELTIKKNNNKQKNAQYTVVIKNESDLKVANYLTSPIATPLDKETYKILLTISEHGLARGKYVLSFAVGKKNYTQENENFDIVQDIVTFQIKYAKISTKLEYLVWNSTWGLTLHVDENITAKLYE